MGGGAWPLLVGGVICLAVRGGRPRTAGAQGLGAALTTPRTLASCARGGTGPSLHSDRLPEPCPRLAARDALQTDFRNRRLRVNGRPFESSSSKGPERRRFPAGDSVWPGAGARGQTARPDGLPCALVLLTASWAGVRLGARRRGEGGGVQGDGPENLMRLGRAARLSA